MSALAGEGGPPRPAARAVRAHRRARGDRRAHAGRRERRRLLLVAGALPQRFLDGLVPQVRRAGTPLTVVVDGSHAPVPLRSRRGALRPRGNRAARAAADRAARAHGEPGRAAVAQLRLGDAARASSRGRSGTCRSSTCCTPRTRGARRRCPGRGARPPDGGAAPARRARRGVAAASSDALGGGAPEPGTPAKAPLKGCDPSRPQRARSPQARPCAAARPRPEGRAGARWPTAM